MERVETTLQQVMFSLIEVWKVSGKSQAEFCKEKAITYHKFHYWFGKYSRQNKLPATQQSSFTRINVNAQPKSYGCIELIYPDGRKLIFNQPVDATFLRNVLA